MNDILNVLHMMVIRVASECTRAGVVMELVSIDRRTHIVYAYEI